MSSEASNEMLSLLKELSVYKAMDEESESAPRARWSQKPTSSEKSDGKR